VFWVEVSVVGCVVCRG